MSIAIFRNASYFYIGSKSKITVKSPRVRDIPKRWKRLNKYKNSLGNDFLKSHGPVLELFKWWRIICDEPTLFKDNYNQYSELRSRNTWVYTSRESIYITKRVRVRKPAIESLSVFFPFMNVEHTFQSAVVDMNSSYWDKDVHITNYTCGSVNSYILHNLMWQTGNVT